MGSGRWGVGRRAPLPSTAEPSCPVTPSTATGHLLKRNGQPFALQRTTSSPTLHCTEQPFAVQRPPGHYYCSEWEIEGRSYRFRGASAGASAARMSLPRKHVNFFDGCFWGHGCLRRCFRGASAGTNGASAGSRDLRSLFETKKQLRTNLLPRPQRECNFHGLVSLQCA